MPYRWLILSLLFLLGMNTLTAQESAWEVVVYDPTQDAMLTLTAGGVQETVSLDFLNWTPTHLSLSHDGRYLVGTAGGIVGLVADLHEQTNLSLFNNSPDFFQRTLNGGRNLNLIVGPFREDSQAVAMGYIVDILGSPRSGMFIYDIESKSITLDIVLDGDFPVTFGEWKAGEIEVGNIQCYNCDQPHSGVYNIWDANARAYWQSERPFGTGVLSSTGEHLYWDYTALDEDRLYYVQTAYLSGTGTVARLPVYVDMPIPSDSPFRTSPHWVWNGEAFLDNRLTIEPREWRLFLRDGTWRSLNVPSGSRFLTGTVDGWLMWHSDGTIDHYAETNDFEPITLTSSLEEHPILVRVTPPLGEGITTDFAIEPCSLLNLDPRLVIDLTARVTPGAPNNLRAEPNGESDLLGEIPGEGEFSVLDGPVCVDGLAWWQVDYNGQIGWTAEGNRNYWLEPPFQPLDFQF